MLIDQAKIYAIGGTGGKGCSSLYKDLFHRKGIPDGGDGGAGGDVIFISDSNLGTLLDFKYNQHYRAGKGAHGGSNTKHGGRGEDRLVKVPVGTIIRDAASNLVIRDLSKPGEQVIAIYGGAGGRGNGRRREATVGDLGEEKTLLLELKLVADVGIIGFPNAGKSTLVSRISKSHSKIAAYPFTTKDPKLGAVRFGDESFIVADMPGLIEGAHAGKGLGDRFLRHIERTRVLIHMVDIYPLDGSDPVDNYFKLEKELELYSAEVAAKPRVIVASKMDLSDSHEALDKFKDKVGKEVLAVSAVQGEGLEKLIEVAYKRLKNVEEKEDEENNSQDRNESLDWLSE